MLRPIRRASVAVAALSVGAVVAGGLTTAAVAATSPAVSLNAITLASESLTTPYAVPSGSVTATAAADSIGLSGTSATSGANLAVSVSAPTDGHLALGTYTTGRFNGAGVAGLDITIASSGCSAETGTLTILEIGRDSGGVINRFAATYRSSCDNNAPEVGELRWHSTVDFIDYGRYDIGTNPLQSVNVTTTADTTFGTATLTGGDATSFALNSDTCSGKTVLAGGTCTIVVKAQAFQAAPVQATLTLPVSGGTSRIVTLDAFARTTPAGAYTSVNPARVLDTRTGKGARKGPVGNGQTISVQVTGTGGVLAVAGVSAVVVNLTAASPTVGGYLTGYAAGSTRPNASSLNFVAGRNRANLATLPVGPTGQISIYAGGGSTQVIGDVVGYYHSTATTGVSLGSFQPTQLQRIEDTRSGPFGPLPGDFTDQVVVDYGDAVNPHIKALAVTVTATQATTSGYLTAFDGADATDPTKVSTLNYAKGDNTPNMAIVPVSSYFDAGSGRTLPQIGVFNGAAGTSSTHVLVDIVGFYDDNTLSGGLRFKKLPAPKRIVDTRSGLGTTKLTAGADRIIQPDATVAGYNTIALVTNATAVRPSASTYFTLYQYGDTRPTVSNVNANVGQVVADMTITPVGSSNWFRLFNAAGSVDSLVDVAGTLEQYPAYPVGLWPTGVGAGAAKATAKTVTGAGAGTQSRHLLDSRSLAPEQRKVG